MNKYNSTMDKVFTFSTEDVMKYGGKTHFDHICKKYDARLQVMNSKKESKSQIIDDSTKIHYKKDIKYGSKTHSEKIKLVSTSYTVLPEDTHYKTHKIKVAFVDKSKNKKVENKKVFTGCMPKVFR